VTLAARTKGRSGVRDAPRARTLLCVYAFATILTRVRVAYTARTRRTEGLLIHTIGDRHQLAGSPLRSAQVRFNRDVVALYAANPRNEPSESQYATLLAQGMCALGGEADQLADTLTRLDDALSVGLLTREEFDLVRRKYWADLERLDHCARLVFGAAL
jgi:hypothetical protein